MTSRGGRTGEEADAVLRPGFEVLEIGAGEGFQGDEGEIGQRGLAGGGGFIGQVDEVDDAEMDAADVVGFVVEEGDDAVGVWALEDQFFVDFAADGGVVGVGAGAAFAGIDRVDVAADADGAFGVEAAFAAGLAAGVAEQVVAAAEEAVGDELFVARVLFGGGAIHEEVVGGVEQFGHGLVQIVGSGAFEGPDFLQPRPGHDQHLFACVFRHGGEHSGRRAKGNGIFAVGGRVGAERLAGWGGAVFSKSTLTRRCHDRMNVGAMNLVELASRIKTARLSRGYTLDRVAEMSGLGKGLLSKVENFRVTPSLPTLAKICATLGIKLADLLDGLDEKPKMTVVRHDGRKEMERDRDQSDIRYFSLAHKRMDRQMDPFELCIPAQGGRVQPMPHEGEEFLLVLEGRVAFEFEGVVTQLAEGDAVYFDAETPHRVFNQTQRDARVLCVFLGRPM